MKKMFIVFCQHTTDHGLTTDLVLLTADLNLAIETANTVETQIFGFLYPESFVVIAAEEGHIYTKKELELDLVSGSSEHYPGVYLRSFVDGIWEKMWLNGTYGRQYDLQREIFGNDHGDIPAGTLVSFKVENQDDWYGDSEGTLVIEEGEFRIKTERSGTLTIDKNYDVCGNTIKPIAVTEPA